MLLSLTSRLTRSRSHFMPQRRVVFPAARRFATTKYTPDHEWIRLDGDVGTIGITEFAAKKLGEVVYIELPEVGTTVEKQATLLSLESVKAASDVYAPMSGTVKETNTSLVDSPGPINQDPEGEGWMVKMKFADPVQLNGLLDEGAYKEHCLKEEH